MPSLKSSVLCFCASSCVEMFKIISPVHQAISIENQQLLLGIPERYPSYNLACLFFGQ